MERDENEQVKIDICSSPFSRRIKEEKFSEEELQNKINQLNTKYEEEYETENINELLFNLNIKGKEYKKIKNENKDISIKELKKNENKMEVVNQDPYLRNFEHKIKERQDAFYNLLKEINKNEGSLFDFAKSYNKMGFSLNEEGLIVFKEYAPGAKALTIFGDFNDWNRDEFALTKDNFGFWSITFPDEIKIPHLSKVKLNLTTHTGKREDRNPVYIKYLLQNSDSLLFDSIYWNPPEFYEWRNKTPEQPKSIRIYEAHAGMSSIEPKVATYREFADKMIPRIKVAGYTCIQLMAVMEHAYYASFGYHVTNFFAVSSRSGTPDDLKYLIDTAHGVGLYVFIDLIHSHASSNVLDGINNFDGTDYCYFHSGAKGFHKLWDSRVFNYKNYETLRFLLSNCAMWIEEYHFDGFRFDGVTSMLYQNHGINFSFSGGLNEYFNDNFDMDGGLYIMLANYVIHTINPNAITIAEDVSGMVCKVITFSLLYVDLLKKEDSALTTGYK